MYHELQLNTDHSHSVRGQYFVWREDSKVGQVRQEVGDGHQWHGDVDGPAFRQERFKSINIFYFAIMHIK